MIIVPGREEWAWCLTAVAHAAKARWRYPVEWLVFWREALTISPSVIARERVSVALIDGTIAGFYVVCGSVPRAELEQLWVLPKFAGRGVGRALFDHALEQLSIAGFSEVIFESDPHASGFYIRCGATIVGVSESEFHGVTRKLPVFRKDVHEVA